MISKIAMWFPKTPDRETAIQNALGDGLRLSVEIEKRNVLNTGEIESSEVQCCQLSLAPGFAEKKSGDARKIQDFEHEREFTVDDAAGTYVDDSLLATAHFRSSEFSNRLYIRDVLIAGGVTDDHFNPTLQSHQLAVFSTEGKAARIQWKEQGRKARAKGYTLFTRSEGAVAVSKANAARFARFLRHDVGGHPLILDRLVQNSVIPNESCLLFPEQDLTRLYTLRVLECEEVTNMSFSLVGLDEITGPTDMGGSDLWSNILKLRETPPEQDFPSRNACAARSRALLDEGNGLDAILTILEFSLTGELDEGLLEFFRIAKEESSDAEALTELMANRPTCDEEAEVYVKAMGELADKATTGADMVGILTASTYLNLGDHERAMELYEQALRTNPRIVGPYKDLGDHMASQYQHGLAYRCWDMARALAPNHGMLSELNETDARLRSDFPEFF